MLVDNRSTATRPGGAKLSVARIKGGPAGQLLNRELSLIEFFRRVLDEGLDNQNPLLERLRFMTFFLKIWGGFFLGRLSGLKEEHEEGWFQPSPDGLTAEEQLREIRRRLRPMIAGQRRCILEEILPQLAEQGIVLATYESLSGAERNELDGYFRQNVFPVLTPLAVD